MIAVSTKTLPEDIAAARNAGINEYLPNRCIQEHFIAS